jgi:hypothetical protein
MASPSARPELRFTLRGLLWGVTALAMLLGSYSLFEVAGVIVTCAVIGGWLHWQGLRDDQVRKSVLGFFVMMPAALLIVAGLFMWCQLGLGPVYFSSSWPKALTRLAAYSDNPYAAKVMCREKGYDLEYQWRLSMTSPQLAELVSAEAWTEIPPAEVTPALFKSFPSFWRPKHHSQCRYYAAGRLLPGNGWMKGEGFLAMHDSDQNRLYVWYVRKR